MEQVEKSTAVILSNGWIENVHAKTTHGILLGSERFAVMGLIDPVYAGKTTGELLNQRLTDVPIYAYSNVVVGEDVVLNG